MRKKKGQFSIIAALLVAVVLITAVIVTYSTIRNFPLQELSKVLSSIDEINLSIKQISEFAIGYYGSVLQVTGNATYAKELTANYLTSGFIYIANSHPNWNPSFNVTQMDFSTLWYEPASYSMANISVSYSLSGLGIYGINYEASSLLNVTILETSENQTRLIVKEGENKTDLTLGRNNFLFYNYSYSDSAWNLVPPDGISIVNGTYGLKIPSGVDPSSYLIQVINPKGVMVTAFFSTSGRPQYTYIFDWNATGMESLYSSLTWDTLTIEALQDGTLRWLGKNLELSTRGKPILPVPVKAFRTSANANSTNLEEKQMPFQIEDWGSKYRVPLGLSSSTSIFSSRNMLVFLVNHKVKNVTLWWDGHDTATQTPYAIQSSFSDKISDVQKKATLNNGIMSIDILYGGDGEFKVETVASTARFMRINGKSAKFYAAPTFVVVNGTVRDIIQQEPEWKGNGAPNPPNVYAQIVLTFPANATYYTYTLRTIFVNASTCPENRILDNLSLIQLSSGWMQGLRSFTENGTDYGFPILAQTSMGDPDMFYNFSNSETIWQHHWSEYIGENCGAGIMFTDSSNLKLYAFDSIAGDKTGALSVTTAQRTVWKIPTNVYDKCGEDSWHPASDAIDNSTGSYWQHNSECNHWTILDMGETMNISKIRIYQYSRSSSRRWGYPDGIEVYVSDDPANWGSVVWNGTLNSGGWQESGVFRAEGRYVKLYSKSSSSSQRMYEVKIECSHDEQSVTIEFNPVERFSAAFTDPKDITWYGAVVTFTDEYDPIWVDGNSGLWVMVEYPPIVSVG